MKNLRTKQVCLGWGCKRRRPAPRKPAHAKVLDTPYEEWVERFGEQCGVCGSKPKGRRLDRDHDHSGAGRPRGLLCHRCNRALPRWVTPEWLENAAEYLRGADKEWTPTKAEAPSADAGSIPACST